MSANTDIIKEGKYEYIETGKDNGQQTPLILLHGLMGALSNFEAIISKFGPNHHIVIPILPIFSMPLKSLDLDGLVDFVEEFIDYKGFKKVFLLGNSLGGHLAQMYCLKRPEMVSKMILTGSSGLFENAFGNSFPRRSSRDYIRKKTEMVFFDRKVATEALVDEVFDSVSDLGRCIRIVKAAKSAVRHNLEDKLHLIKTPTLLVWGAQDEVTPLWVGKKFHELLQNSTLVVFEKCGHAPMMEHPDDFNKEIYNFLSKD
ncbi:MAG: alpha/beta hydrolase [Saprospiraceae bacterium]|nr:alpha/beta hydrolase [Saprospiraceae bacterium]